ncbi:MAG: hypothetical protein ACKO3K_03805, partial [Cuspidothrix sp.]
AIFHLINLVFNIMIHDHTSNFSQQAIALPKYKQKAIALHPTYIKQRSHFILPTLNSDRTPSYLHQTAIAFHPPTSNSDRIPSSLKWRSHLQTNPLNEIAILQTSYSFTDKITKSIDIQPTFRTLNCHTTQNGRLGI